jgi:bloom syndrome protein
MALTATAKKTVADDIIERLGIPGCLFLSQSFNRQNLHYVVRPKTRNVLDTIAGYINGRHPTSSGVIYCFSRSNCEDVARALREKHNISARHYHAGMSIKDKATVQKAWQEGECHVIVATASALFLFPFLCLKRTYRLHLAWASTKQMVELVHELLLGIRLIVHF